MTMRSSYKRELKKVFASERSGAGGDEVYSPSLWYFSEFIFLRDLQVPQPSTSTMDNFEEDLDASDLSASTQNSSKRNRTGTSKERFFSRAMEFLEKEPEDGKLYAQVWERSFARLSGQQQVLAKRLIDETLALGELGQLTLETKVTVSPPPSAASSLSGSLSSSFGKENYFRGIHTRTSTPVEVVSKEQQVIYVAAKDEDILSELLYLNGN